MQGLQVEKAHKDITLNACVTVWHTTMLKCKPTAINEFLMTLEAGCQSSGL